MKRNPHAHHAKDQNAKQSIVMKVSLNWLKDYLDIDALIHQGTGLLGSEILSWSSQKNVPSDIKVEFKEKGGKTKISIDWKNEQLEVE